MGWCDSSQPRIHNSQLRIHSSRPCVHNSQLCVHNSQLCVHSSNQPRIHNSQPRIHGSESQQRALTAPQSTHNTHIAHSSILTILSCCKSTFFAVQSFNILLRQSLRTSKEPETHVSETQCHVSEWVGGWAHGYQRSGTPAPLLAAAGSQSS